MKLSRTEASRLAALALTIAAAPAAANSLCSLPPSSCLTGTPPTFGCSKGCPVPINVWHPSIDPCGTGGSFSLVGTEFERTCFSGACPGGVAVPPFRFWELDEYGGASGANSGCSHVQTVSPFFVNPSFDLGIATAPAGKWVFYQANWFADWVDGCVAPLPNRTVAEVSFPAAAAEGSVDHFSWYLLASVPSGTSGFSFDDVTGASGGCSARDVPAVPVPGVTVGTKTPAPGTCTGDPARVTTSPHPTASLANVTVQLVDPSPTWASEAGTSAPPDLILGYQVLYRGGGEPTSSSAAGWLPAVDPNDPASMLVVPRGSSSAVVSLPAGPGGFCQPPGQEFWLATRLVYVDASVNAGPFPLSGPGPRLVSALSSHCGPVYCPHADAVEFDAVWAERTRQGGVRVGWTTLSEDDTLGFVVLRFGDEGGESAVEVGSVEAHGPSLPYEVLDLALGPADEGWYAVQELTLGGPGDRSPLVHVERGGLGAANGRGRGRARRTQR